MTETENKTATCPTCGSTASDGSCCQFAGRDKSEKIPVTAELLRESGVRVPIDLRWMRIGREPDNDIVLQDDGYASRYHCWVTFEQDRFWVEDLGSTNGTVLNGAPLTRRELLASGDKIKIGESELTFILLEKTNGAS